MLKSVIAGQVLEEGVMFDILFSPAAAQLQRLPSSTGIFQCQCAPVVNR